MNTNAHSAHEALEVEHEARRLDHRIDRGVGSGAVAPAPAHRDVDAVDVRQHVAAGERDGSGGEVRLYMHGEGIVGLRKTFKEPVFEHGAGLLNNNVGIDGDEIFGFTSVLCA